MDRESEGEDSDDSGLFSSNFKVSHTNSEFSIPDTQSYELPTLFNGKTDPMLSGAQQWTRQRSTRKSKIPGFFEKVTTTGKQNAKLVRDLITTSDERTGEEDLTKTSAKVKLWIAAIAADLATLKDEGTWSEALEPLANIKALPSHVSLKFKRNRHGEPQEFEACVVAGGNHQIV